MSLQASDQAGDSKPGEIESPLASQSIGEERQKSTSATLDITAQQSQDSQPTSSLPEVFPQGEVKLLLALADVLLAAGLVEWRFVRLGDARAGWVLFFQDTQWSRVGSELAVIPNALGGRGDG